MPITCSAWSVTGSESTLPTKEGSRPIVSGASFSKRDTTSLSRRCLDVWKGLASKVSKFGSPDPGTIIDEYLFRGKQSFRHDTDGKEKEGSGDRQISTLFCLL